MKTQVTCLTSRQIAARRRVGASPVVSGVVSLLVSVYALGCDTPARPLVAGQAACEPPAGEGDCISVQQRIPIYQ